MKTTTAVSAMRPRLAALAAAALLAGCSMIPAYERPAAPVAPAWAGTPGTAAAQPAADIEWQSYFNDAQLRQLITLALQGNRDLRVAALNIEQARAQYQVRGADRFPTVNAAVTGSRTINPSSTICCSWGKRRSTRAGRSIHSMRIGRSLDSTSMLAVWMRLCAPKPLKARVAVAPAAPSLRRKLRMAL
ncbi:MAG TPA: TolC family protein [Caldilinea sp.]|nr:TolC family protein [Caldilinea sp.]